MARRAYPKWHASFTHLFRKHGRPQQHPRPVDFDGVMARGQGMAGSPETLRNWLRAQVEETGVNYIVGQFAFGDLSAAECESSVQLFADHIMPSISKPVALSRAV
jgi:hypothetical protein